MPTYALVDCNNFFVSCERLFNPKLKGKPVIVLSNNDGCAVSRSNEVKALGITMGTPYFKIKELVKKHDIQVFSSNFILYGDISNRVMDTLRTFSQDVEIYSIDEAFLDLTDFEPQDLTDYGQKIKKTVQKWVGIPVSIGIAKTKTLTKIASEIAKKNPKYNGVLNLSSYTNIDEFLQMIKISDVWGIGRQYTKFLLNHGIKTALNLVKCEENWVKKNLTITGLNLVKELKGISCFDFDALPPAKKSITSSRSFGTKVSEYREIKEALASYISIAAEKLRQQKLITPRILVYITTNYFNKNSPQYSNSQNLKLRQATDHTPTLIKYGEQILKKIYKPNFIYKKVGVVFLDLISKNKKQLNLFADQEKTQQNEKTMKTLDFLNNRFGSGAVSFASSGIKKKWKNKKEKLSSRFTSNWDEIPKVKAN